MKKYLVIIPLLFLVACSSNNDEGLALAKEYTGEIVPLVNNAFLEITGQAVNGELDDSLLEYVEKINAVNDEYWKDLKFGGKYDDEQISKWKFLMGNSQGKWEIEGEELSDALAYMNLYSGYLADDIEKALKESTDQNLANLGESLGLTQEAAEKLRKLLTNQ